MPIAGTHHVRALKSALRKARGYWPKKADLMEVRDHTLKLRFWGQRHHASGTVVDLDYSPIRSMPDSGVYELRIDDEIGGQRNIRVIFFDPPTAWKAKYETPLKPLWVLETFPKRRNEFTTFDVDRFWGLRETVQQRFFRL